MRAQMMQTGMHDESVQKKRLIMKGPSSLCDAMTSSVHQKQGLPRYMPEVPLSELPLVHWDALLLLAVRTHSSACEFPLASHWSHDVSVHQIKNLLLDKPQANFCWALSDVACA